MYESCYIEKIDILSIKFKLIFNMATNNDKEKKRLQIITLHQNTTKSIREIADDLDVSIGLVHKVIKQQEEEGNVDLHYKGNCGHPKLFDDRDLRHIKDIVIKNPRLTARGVQKELGECGDGISIRTMQRALNEAGCKAIKPSKCPLLTAVQIQKRYQWAKEHATWGIEEWKKVIWSDETMLRVEDNCPRFVRLVDGHEKTADHYLKSVKHPTQVMIWSCFYYGGTGRAHVVEKNLNSEEYIAEIVNRRVVPQLRDWFEAGGGLFQQDNAPCHVSKRTLQHLQESGVRVLPWPPSSPDINPIENLWAIVKRRVRDRQPSTKSALISAFLSVWNRDEEIQEMCKKLVNSMPSRVEEILENKGGATKF